MVDTTLDPVAQIEPPLTGASHNQDTGIFTQTWVNYFTDISDRINSMWQQLLTIRNGVTDGSDAAPGQIGEYMQACGSGSLTGAVAVDMATLTLTAGDWDVTGSANFSPSAVTLLGADAWLNTAAATPANPGRMSVFSEAAGAGTLGFTSVVVGPVRISIAAPATQDVHLGVMANFSGPTTVSANVLIRARRVR